MEDASLKFLSSTPTSSLKFNLFLKAHELKEVSKVLENVLLLSEKERKIWAKDNGEVINQAIDSFVKDSNATLSELTFDEETLQLSKELVTSLRDTVDMVQDILFDGHKLSS